MNQVLGDLGSALDNPLWTLVFLSFTSVLQLRITYSGVYDVREGKKLSQDRKKIVKEGPYFQIVQFEPGY
jgi:adenine deaminase